MKLPDPPPPLCPRRQKRSSEMQRPFLLPKSTTGNDADTRGVEEAKAVEGVRGAVFLFRLFDGAGGQGDGGVEVHGTLFDRGQQEEGKDGNGKGLKTVPAVPDTPRPPFP